MGGLLVDRWTPPAAGIEVGLVHRLYDETAARLGSDGWVVERTTMAELTEAEPRPRRR